MGVIPDSIGGEVVVDIRDAKRWKGKKRDTSNVGPDGQLVSMKLVGDGVYTA